MPAHTPPLDFIAAHDRLERAAMPASWVDLSRQATMEGWTHEAFLAAIMAQPEPSSGATPTAPEPPDVAREEDRATAELPLAADTRVEVFPWTPRLETGIAQIDREHHRLVDLINSLATHIGREADAETLDGIFGALADYANQHFKAEEQIWVRTFGADPWFTDHQDVHATFLDQVDQLQSSRETARNGDIMVDVLGLMIRWLAHHILEDDMRLAKVVHARAGGLGLEAAKAHSVAELANNKDAFIETVMEMYQLLSVRTVELLRERTARKRVSDGLRSAKEAAEKANEAKSAFLANMSHELRTPLNAILGFADVLAGGAFGELNERQGRYAKHISSSGTHLLSLINDILDLSKVEAGKATLELEPVRPGPLLKASSVLFREKAMKHAISLEIRTDPSALKLEIAADQRKIKQIYYNLLSNALKFTPDGGRVRARVMAKGTGMCLHVTDSGIGIAADDLERVFSTFEQIDSALARQSEGTGLGLALTRQLVELHGGRVWAESEGLGKGATFVVVLPDCPPDDVVSA